MTWIATFVIIVGLYISCMNWLIFINNHILKGHSSSYGLFVGGLLLCGGIMGMPAPYNHYFYLGLFIDFGCIPWLLVGILFRIFEYFKKRFR